MKKTLTSSIALFSLLLSYHAGAANKCSVLGINEPNTNIYDGPTWCENTKLSNLIVRGPLIISNTKITGSAEISGPIQSTFSNFTDLVIHSSLTHQKVILSKKTVVNGNLVFKGIKGELYIDPTSKVVGKIINAEIHLNK